MGLAGRPPGPLGVELGVVLPPPFVCFFFGLIFLGGCALDACQQGFCTSPFCCFPPKTFSSKLVQGWGSRGEESGQKAHGPWRPHPPSKKELPPGTLQWTCCGL